MQDSPLRQLPTTTLVKMAIGAKLKEFFMPRMLGSWGSYVLGMSRTQYNYMADVGDGLLSSVVMPTVQWIMRSFPEAPLVVRTRTGDELEIVDGHPLAQLIDRPNPFYPGALLWMATVSDWCWWGESYWRIVFERGGRPGQLWWLPPWTVEPKWPNDGSAYLTHYDYHPEMGTTIRLELEEVCHFRHGLDPRNPRHGLPPCARRFRIFGSIWRAITLSAPCCATWASQGLFSRPRATTA